MTDVILHHYPMSPYAEKVRKALGIKRLAWRSVTIPVIMPKPDLTPLTGGYRKTPVMQIGADIYCDSQLILRELERRFPEPSFYRGSDAGTANALSFYLDRTLFSPVVGMTFGLSPKALPEGFAEDRAKLMGRELNLERLKQAVPMLLDQLRPQFAWIEAMLVDGRAYLCGEHPTTVDCSAYQLCWFITTNVSGATPPLGELPKMHAWMQRMAAHRSRHTHGDGARRKRSRLRRRRRRKSKSDRMRTIRSGARPACACRSRPTISGVIRWWVSWWRCRRMKW